MKTAAARRCRALNRLRGPWNEFAGMEWQACFQALKKIFRSFSTLRVFLVLSGAGGETFTARNYIGFMNSSPRR
jgi:hypothetical protein